MSGSEELLWMAIAFMGGTAFLLIWTLILAELVWHLWIKRRWL